MDLFIVFLLKSCGRLWIMIVIDLGRWTTRLIEVKFLEVAIGKCPPHVANISKRSLRTTRLDFRWFNMGPGFLDKPIYVTGPLTQAQLQMTVLNSSREESKHSNVEIDSIKIYFSSLVVLILTNNTKNRTIKPVFLISLPLPIPNSCHTVVSFTLSSIDGV